MAKPTKVFFENNSRFPVKIKPARSSEKRFEAFTLKPGDKVRSLKDSNPGSGNKDIEWDVIINPGNPDREVLASFAADNPNYWFSYIHGYTDNFWSADKVTNKNNPYRVNGQDYITSYSPNVSIEGPRAGESIAVGRINPSKLDTYWYEDVPLSTRRDLRDRTYFHFSKGKYDAFASALPIAKIEFLGDDSGEKSWGFTLENL